MSKKLLFTADTGWCLYHYYSDGLATENNDFEYTWETRNGFVWWSDPRDSCWYPDDVAQLAYEQYLLSLITEV